MIAIVAAEGRAGAARPGELAAASRASLTISASVAGRVEAVGVADVSLVRLSGIKTATALQRVCIRSNSATGRYDLAATGAADGKAFVLAAAGGSTVPLTLRWTDAGAISKSLLPGTPLQGLIAQREACAAGAQSMLAIAAPATNGAPAAGVITLTLAPM